MPIDVPCWWYLSGQCRHMADYGYNKCRFMHYPYALMLTHSLSGSSHIDNDGAPDCLPSCDHYSERWDEGFGCSSEFRWWLFRTPAECPCRVRGRVGDERMEEEECDDDVIIVKREGEDGYQQQQQLLQRLQQQRVETGENKSVEKEEEKEADEQKEQAGDDAQSETETAAEEEDEEEEEWTAILPVPLHYLCLRALTAPSFAIFLQSAMGQTERDNGVHVVMHQQPCDARKPLQWGHVILYGSKEEVEKGKKALCAVMDSGYQYKADGRLLVAVVQRLSDETEDDAHALLSSADTVVLSGRGGEPYSDEEEWNSEDEAEYGAREPAQSSDVEASAPSASRVRRAADVDEELGMTEEERQFFDNEDYQRDDAYWLSVQPPPGRAASPAASVDSFAPSSARPACAPRRSARLAVVSSGPTSRKRHQTTHPSAYTPASAWR